jgi:hypothetical protein
VQRDPKGVAAKADDAPVRVRRRDGVPLVLMREDRAEDAVRGAATAARALRMALKRLDPSEIAVTLRDEFPWLDVLPPADLALFTTDFSRAIEACAELGEWGLFTRTITEWKATAAVHADPELHRILTTPATDDFGPVQPPAES